MAATARPARRASPADGSGPRTAAAIRELLRSAADPVRAEGQQAYMKSAMPFWGVPVPEVRRMVRPALAGLDAIGALALHGAQPARCAGRHEHADAPLHLNEAIILEALIGLGHGQRIGALLRSKGAHRGQHVAIPIFSVQDRCGDEVAQAQIDGPAFIDHAASVT